MKTREEIERLLDLCEQDGTYPNVNTIKKVLVSHLEALNKIQQLTLREQSIHRDLADAQHRTKTLEDAMKGFRALINAVGPIPVTEDNQ